MREQRYSREWFIVCDLIFQRCVLSVWAACCSSVDRIDRKKDKAERKILDSQERAFWDVHRPVVSLGQKSSQAERKECHIFLWLKPKKSRISSTLWSAERSFFVVGGSRNRVGHFADRPCVSLTLPNREQHCIVWVQTVHAGETLSSDPELRCVSHRLPQPGCVNTTEMDIRKCRREKNPHRVKKVRRGGQLMTNPKISSFYSFIFFKSLQKRTSVSLLGCKVFVYIYLFVVTTKF